MTFTPETMAKHVHYLQQRFDTQLPGKIIKLQEKRHIHERLTCDGKMHAAVTVIML